MQAQKQEEKKIVMPTAGQIWDELQMADLSVEGRIPTYLGKFEHEGVVYDFDEDVMKGGMYRSVGCISGFPGNGKTSVAISVGTRQAINGYRILYITQEQTKEEIVEKVLAELSELPFDVWENVKFKTEQADFEEMKKQGAKYLETYLGGGFKIVEKQFKPKELIDFIKNVMQNFDVIYVDNIQNCDIAVGGEAKELNNLTNTMKTVMNSWKKTALVWLSQLTPDKTQNPVKATPYYCNKIQHDVLYRLVVHRYASKQESENDKKEEAKPVKVDAPKSYISLTKNRKSQTKLSEVKDATFKYDTIKGKMGEFIMPKMTDELKKKTHDRHNAVTAEEAEEGLDGYIDHGNGGIDVQEEVKRQANEKRDK